jgi:predicted patatin/cPLA2 family phospholipase
LLFTDNGSSLPVNASQEHVPQVANLFASQQKQQLATRENLSMIHTEPTFMVSGDKEVINAIKHKVEQLSEHPVQISERHNLDGSVSTAVMVCTVGMQAITLILTFIKEYVNMQKVKKIKVGDIEIENPDDRLIEVMRKKLANG